MAETFYVAPDAIERLSTPPEKPATKVFLVDWEIMGQLEIVAASEEEAYRKSIMFSKERLADAGELTTYWPHEKDDPQ